MKYFHIYLTFAIYILIQNLIFAQEWNERVKLTETIRDEYDYFGHSVSISGDYAIVGAYRHDYDENDANDMNDAGAAYILKKDASGNWEHHQKIVPAVRNSYDEFGGSVFISGDYAIIGAENEDEDEDGNNFLMQAGSAYIFKRNLDDTWTEEQKIVASDRQEHTYYGNSVAINSDYAIVGSAGSDGHRGAAYIYEKDVNDIWNQTARVNDVNSSVYAEFGTSVAISNDFAIVGAENQDFGGANDGGKVYVYSKEADIWTLYDSFGSPDPDDHAYFGCSVSISEDYLVVGEYETDYYSGGPYADYVDAGAAYIYKWDAAGNWEYMQKISASDKGSNARFGHSVSISDDKIVSGALGENKDIYGNNIKYYAGAAYLYQRNTDESWSELQKVVPSDRASDDQFGYSVSVSGVNIIGGARYEDHNAGGSDSVKNAGSVYVFDTLNVKLATKLFLEGPYDEINDEMFIAINDSIPATSPYVEDARTVESIPADAVDWILVELRETPGGGAAASKSVFLHKDGRVIDVDGTVGEIKLPTLAGSYYVVIKHRNHLAVMSKDPIPLN